mmetsp:Transcript_55199/g.87513  ORF Transcript_55199/g.87513 Transcript_55199/m.87513 type:complete len:418 (-) Transcript_55199:285-1538(-)
MVETRRNFRRLSSIEKALETLVWQNATTSTNIDLASHRLELPEGMPQEVIYFLFCNCIIPLYYVKSPFRRVLYQVYRLAFLGNIMFGAICSALTQIANWRWDEEISVLVILYVAYVITALAFRELIKKQLDLTLGATMSLAHQLSKRGFVWDQIQWSVRFVCASTFCLTSGICFTYFYDFVYGESLWQSAPEGQTGVVDLALSWIVAISYFGLPVWFFCSMTVFLMIPWFVYLLAKLHQHELLGYQKAVTFILDGRAVRDLEALTLIELTITKRFCHASKSIVKWVVFLIYATLTYIMVLCVYLIVTPYRNDLAFLTRSVISLLWMSGLITSLSAPLALVRETFEHDVVRLLNAPDVLRRSQTFFGQQYLAHLNALDWGFRFGGRVIHLQSVSGMASGMFFAIVATATQLLFSESGL